MSTRLALVAAVALGCGTSASTPAHSDAGAPDALDAQSAADSRAPLHVPEAGDAPTLRVPELGPVPPLPTFAGDPPSADKSALGRLLFFDTRLSGSGHTSCNACHIPGTAFQDSLPLSTPDRSYPDDSPTLTRNTLSMMNLVYANVFRWDGSNTDMVDVMAFPLAEPNMNIAGLPRGSTQDLVPQAQAALQAKLTTELAGYLPLYDQAFGVDTRTTDAPGLWRLTGRALRAFVTVAVSRDSAFDRWNTGDDSAMSAAAVQGLAVFRGKGRCVQCHSGPLFTDFSFHNLSTSPPGDSGQRADNGRYDVTNDPKDLGAFLTPTLRQTYDTSPYFHDGSSAGLVAVLAHLASPSVMADPNHDPIFDTPLDLQPTDESNLIAFLEALRGAPIVPPVAPSAFP